MAHRSPCDPVASPGALRIGGAATSPTWTRAWFAPLPESWAASATSLRLTSTTSEARPLPLITNAREPSTTAREAVLVMPGRSSPDIGPRTRLSRSKKLTLPVPVLRRSQPSLSGLTSMSDGEAELTSDWMPTNRMVGAPDARSTTTGPPESLFRT